MLYRCYHNGTNVVTVPFGGFYTLGESFEIDEANNTIYYIYGSSSVIKAPLYGYQMY